jgi:hypothetical protein
MKDFGDFTRRRLMGPTDQDRIIALERRQGAQTIRLLSNLAGMLPDLIGQRIISPTDPANVEPIDANFSGWVIAALTQALADGNFTLAQILLGAVQYGIGDNGEFIRGVSFLSNHLATVGTYNRRVRRGFQEVSGKPAYLIEYIDDAVGTNLITSNPGFESGDFTGYATSANWAVVSDPYSGTYAAQSTNISGAPLVTNKYAISAGSSYAFSVQNKITTLGCANALIEAKWYNAVPTLLKTDVIWSGAPTIPYVKAPATLLAPAGATQVEISITPPMDDGFIVDDLSIVLVSEYAAIRWSDTGVDILDETGVIASFSATGGIGKAPSGTGAITAVEGYWQWQSTRKAFFLYDGQRERALSPIGWTPYAYQIGAGPADSFASSSNLALNGGTVAIPMLLTASMLLEQVDVWNNDTSLQRGWNWSLYEQYLNNGNGGENTLTQVAVGTAAEVFTPGAASLRTIAAASKPVYLPPGLYWLCIQNTNTSRTFALGRVNVGTMALNAAQSKTLAIPLGGTLDLVAATWTKNGNVWGARLDGRVFGQTTAF